MTKLNPNERLLVESGPGRYRLVGPGRVWLKPWQRALVRLYVGPQAQSIQLRTVPTSENMPLAVTLQVMYRFEPGLLTPALLPGLKELYEGGWSSNLVWRTELILRRLCGGCAWRELQQEGTLARLERRLTCTLGDQMKPLGLAVREVCLIKMELPAELQRTFIQVERDSLEARGWVLALQAYADLFDQDLSRVMPLIGQWELLNILRQKGQAQLILTGSAPGSSGRPLEPDPPVFQMHLPLPREV